MKNLFAVYDEVYIDVSKYFQVKSSVDASNDFFALYTSGVKLI